jgi:hypothetical protein
MSRILFGILLCRLAAQRAKNVGSSETLNATLFYPRIPQFLNPLTGDFPLLTQKSFPCAGNRDELANA